jgi:hypothetical protein
MSPSYNVLVYQLTFFHSKCQVRPKAILRTEVVVAHLLVRFTTHLSDHDWQRNAGSQREAYLIPMLTTTNHRNSTSE